MNRFNLAMLSWPTPEKAADWAMQRSCGWQIEDVSEQIHYLRGFKAALELHPDGPQITIEPDRIQGVVIAAMRAVAWIEEHVEAEHSHAKEAKE